MTKLKNVGLSRKLWDFPVERVAVQTVSGLSIDDRLAVVRTDTNKVIGYSSKKYYLLKHGVAIEAIESNLSLLGGFNRDSVNITHNGARLFISYTFPETMVNIGKGDKVCLQLMAANSYDSSRHLSFLLGGWRYVCSNGLRSGIDLVYINSKHYHVVEDVTKDLSSRIGDALIQFTDNLVPKYQKLMEEGIKVQDVLDKMIENKKLFIPKKVIEAVRRPAVKEMTKWELYNDFTRYLTHDYQGSYDRKLTIEQQVGKYFGV